jgi:biopolymer transport protein ExbB
MNFPQYFHYQTMLSRFLEGGPVMFVILAFSILGLGLWLRVWLSLSHLQKRVLLPDAMNTYLDLVRGKQFETLREGAQSPANLPRAIARRLMEFPQETNDELRHLARSIASGFYRPLSSSARWVLTASRISPLLGLLGTVIGISKSFREVAVAGGLGDYEKLAGGITQALYTTIFGLIVSLALILLFQLLAGKIQRQLHLLEDYADEFILLMKRAGAEHDS